MASASNTADTIDIVTRTDIAGKPEWFVLYILRAGPDAYAPGPLIKEDEI